MKKISLIIAFILVSFVSISSQQGVAGKEIKNRDVEWSDFVGEIDESSNFDAYTTWKITYTYSKPTFKNDIAQVTATVRLFLGSDSWVRPDKRTPSLINHERGHYKIGRICAREIEETINSTDFDRNDYVQQINELFSEILEKYKEFEKDYDAETNHYNNQEQQTVWDKKLDDLLKQ